MTLIVHYSGLYLIYWLSRLIWFCYVDRYKICSLTTTVSPKITKYNLFLNKPVWNCLEPNLFLPWLENYCLYCIKLVEGYLQVNPCASTMPKISIPIFRRGRKNSIIHPFQFAIFICCLFFLTKSRPFQCQIWSTNVFTNMKCWIWTKVTFCYRAITPFCSKPK